MEKQPHQNFYRYQAAEEAMKDILYLFYTCVQYNSLFSDIGTEDGRFNPYFYIDCGEAETGDNSVDFDLLHTGSAIKLTCEIVQSWDQGGYQGYDGTRHREIHELLEHDRLRHLPELRDYLRDALISQEKCIDGSRHIYETYVAGYFRRMLED